LGGLKKSGVLSCSPVSLAVYPALVASVLYIGDTVTGSDYVSKFTNLMPLSCVLDLRASVTKRVKRCKKVLFRKRHRRFCQKMKRKIALNETCCNWMMVPKDDDNSTISTSTDTTPTTPTTTPTTRKITTAELPECDDNNNDDVDSNGRGKDDDYNWEEEEDEDEE